MTKFSNVTPSSIALLSLLALMAAPLARAEDAAKPAAENQSPAETKPSNETSAAEITKDAKEAKGTKKDSKKDSKPAAQTATIKTSEGSITVKLFADRAPKTVENFIGLSNGKKEWKDPKSGKPVKGKPLYNGTIFHRIIPNFMVQGGDPQGDGTGGPGYQFEDETSSSDQFDRPYILAMANAGPNTNGSQFFITVAATPWLNGKHTIFGEVTQGQAVVDKIVKAARGANDRPEKPVKIVSIKLGK